MLQRTAKTGKTLYFQREYFMQLPQIAQEMKSGRCWMQKHTVHPPLTIKRGNNSHNRTLHIQVGPLNKRTPHPNTPLFGLYLSNLTHTITHTHKPPDTSQHTPPTPPPPHRVMSGSVVARWLCLTQDPGQRRTDAASDGS